MNSKFLRVILLIAGVCLMNDSLRAQSKKRIKFDFTATILYTDDTRDSIQTDLIQDQNSERYFLLRNECDKIFAHQTKQIVLYENSSGRTYLGEVFPDSNWYFKIYAGNNLQVYVRYPGRERIRHIRVVQTSSPDKLLVYSDKTLRKLLRENPNSRVHWNRHRQLRATQNALQALGVVVAFGGIVQPFILPPIGIAIVTSSFVLEKLSRKHLQKAVTNF